MDKSVTLFWSIDLLRVDLICCIFIDLIIILYCVFNILRHIHPSAAAFLTTMLRDKTTDFWIGFSNLANGRFKWTDGSQVAFTEWANGEPQNYRVCAYFLSIMNLGSLMNFKFNLKIFWQDYGLFFFSLIIVFLLQWHSYYWTKYHYSEEQVLW